jgi:hypothetical protein
MTIHAGHASHSGNGISLYAESHGLKAKLLEMNEHGLFTFRGQPRTSASEEYIACRTFTQRKGASEQSNQATSMLTVAAVPALTSVPQTGRR